MIFFTPKTALIINKKAPKMGLFHYAEREGFEPPNLLQSTVFKTAAFNHSAISPGPKLKYQTDIQKVFFNSSIYFLYSDNLK